MRKLTAVEKDNSATINKTKLVRFEREVVLQPRGRGSFMSLGLSLTGNAPLNLESKFIPEVIQDELGSYVLIFRKKGEGE